MLPTIPQSTGTRRKTILVHWGEGGPLDPGMTEKLRQKRISERAKIILILISVPEKVLFTSTYFLKQQIESPAPPGMAKCKGLLTLSSTFSYSRATGSHPRNPQRAGCFCLCSTGLILLFRKHFVVENRDTSLRWSQFLFFVQLQQDF